MQGEWTGRRYGQGSNVYSEQSSAGPLQTPSRAGRQVYHNVSRPRPACPILPKPLLHGLDTLWYVGTTRIGRGRRWTGATDGGRETSGEDARECKKDDGDRLGRLRWKRAVVILACKDRHMVSREKLGTVCNARKPSSRFASLDIPSLAWSKKGIPRDQAKNKLLLCLWEQSDCEAQCSGLKQRGKRALVWLVQRWRAGTPLV